MYSRCRTNATPATMKPKASADDKRVNIDFDSPCIIEDFLGSGVDDESDAGDESELGVATDEDVVEVELLPLELELELP